LHNPEEKKSDPQRFLSDTKLDSVPLPMLPRTAGSWLHINKLKICWNVRKKNEALLQSNSLMNYGEVQLLPTGSALLKDCPASYNPDRSVLMSAKP
jgi:hypothetical protein